MSDQNSQQQELVQSQEVEKKELPSWNCQLTPDEKLGTPSFAEFSVGAKLLLNCEGEFVEGLDDKIQFEFPQKENSWSLHVLEARSVNPQSVQLIVTGYKAGQYRAVPFEIKNDKIGFQSKLSWTTQSVLKQDPMNPAKPYGPFGPYAMSMPLWYWASWVGFALIILLFILRKVKRHFQRKKMLEELASHATALTPYNQFNKDIRSLARKVFITRSGQGNKNYKPGDYILELDNTFKLYLVRELQVPALDWSVRDVMGEVKGRYRTLHRDSGSKLRKLLTEFNRAERAHAQTSFDDCEQLTAMSRQLATEVFRHKRILK